MFGTHLCFCLRSLDLREILGWNRQRFVSNGRSQMETEPPAINLSEAEKEILLSYAYCLGAEVVENAAEVVSFFRKYAEAGHAFAQNTLGKMYFKGDWVEKNDAEAANWYRKSAEQGFVHAQNNLGTMLSLGDGVEKDPVEAVKWLTKAAEQAALEE